MLLSRNANIWKTWLHNDTSPLNTTEDVLQLDQLQLHHLSQYSHASNISGLLLPAQNHQDEELIYARISSQQPPIISSSDPATLSNPSTRFTFVESGWKQVEDDFYILETSFDIRKCSNMAKCYEGTEQQRADELRFAAMNAYTPPHKNIFGEKVGGFYVFLYVKGLTPTLPDDSAHHQIWNTEEEGRLARTR